MAAKPAAYSDKEHGDGYSEADVFDSCLTAFTVTGGGACAHGSLFRVRHRTVETYGAVSWCANRTERNVTADAMTATTQSQKSHETRTGVVTMLAEVIDGRGR
jgi:hypothetical protein